jgi:hypothetical protein
MAAVLTFKRTTTRVTDDDDNDDDNDDETTLHLPLAATATSTTPPWLYPNPSLHRYPHKNSPSWPKTNR